MTTINRACTQEQGLLFNTEPEAQSWSTTLNLWWKRYQGRRQLKRMPQYLWEDMGLTQKQVREECQKPFWENGIY